MADERISTILAVELDAGKVAQELEDLSRQIANAKNEQKLLNEQLKAGEITETEYAKSTAAVKDELSWLQKQQKGVIATTKLLTAQTDTYSDSLNGERQKLADMQKAYDQLDKSQRESEGGKEFLAAIKAQSDAVKKLEEETGRAQRNVGNYPKAWGAAVPALSEAQSALSGMGVSMKELEDKGAKAFKSVGQSLESFGKAFLTPPIVVVTAVLGAIMFAVQKVSEAFKKNDSAMTALQKAFAVFEPIGDAVAKVFDTVAVALGKVAEGAAKVVQWIAGKLSPAYADAAAKAQELVQAQDDLQEAEREYTVESAKRNRDIAELKAKISQTEKYTFEERKQFLKDAIELERQNLEEAKNNATERLRILEETAKKESDTSDETKDKIAQARAAVYQAEQAYFDGTRKLQKQLTDFEAEEKQKRVDAYIEEWNAKRLAAEAALATEKALLEELKANAQEALEALDESEEGEEIPTPEKMALTHFGLDEEGVQYFMKLYGSGVDFANAKSQALKDQWDRNAKGILQAAKNIGSGFTAMADLLGEVSEESEGAAKAQKAFAFIGILTNQAQSISEGALALAKGIESAAGVPFPANIPSIITVTASISAMLAGIASTITQSKQIFQQATDAGKFATGGVVGGTSYTGDKLVAHVNSGEGIYTGKQANTILQEIANNPLRGSTEAMTEALVAAIAAMPAPVMDYTEFRNFEQDVATYNELSKI